MTPALLSRSVFPRGIVRTSVRTLPRRPPPPPPRLSPHHLARHASTGRPRGRPKKSAAAATPPWFFLADVHISEGTRARLLPFFDFFFAEFDRLRPSHVFFLGDTFHMRSGTDSRDLRLFVDIVARILAAPWAPTVHLLIGNHDMKNQSSRTDHALSAFELAAPRVVVYAENTIADIDGRSVVLVPFHSDERDVRDYLREHAELLRDSVLCYHGPVNGAVMAGARAARPRVCEGTALEPATLATARQAFLGHFHKHGPVAGDGKVVYVGAPIQSNAGDAGDVDRGFVVYRPDSGEWALHRNPAAEYFLTTTLEEVESVLPRAHGKVVSVLLREGEEDGEKIGRALKALREAGARSVRDVRAAPRRSAAEIATEATQNVEFRMEEMVEGWMEERARMEGTDPALDAERKRLFLELLKTLPQTQGKADSAFVLDFSKIIMHNFRGIRGTTVLDIAALPKGEVFLVSGVNGSGKSTMIEAVTWCMFGKFLSANISSEDIAHRGTRETYVTIEFANGWSITRSRNGKKTKTVGFDIRNPDGELVDIGHSAAARTEWWTKEMLGMNLSMFKQCCVIGDNAEYFTRPTSEKERAAAMDELFGLEGMAETREVLQERLKKLDAEKTELERNLERTTRDQEESQRQLEEKSKAIQKAEAELADSRAKMEDYKQELQSIAAELDQWREKKEQYEEELRQCEEQLANERDAVVHAECDLILAAKAELQLCTDALAEVLSDIATEIQELQRRQREREEILQRERIEHRRLQNILLRALATLTSAVLRLFGLHNPAETPSPTPAQPALLPPPPQPPASPSPSLTARLAALRSTQTTHRLALTHHHNTLGTLHAQHHKLQQLRTDTITHLTHLHERQHKLQHDHGYQDGRIGHVSSDLTDAHTAHTTHTTTLRTLAATHRTLLTTHTTLTHLHAHTLFWHTSLRDTDHQKGALLTFCRSRYITHINTLLTRILPSLCSGSTHLNFQLRADLTLRATPGALAVGERSRGQRTRTFLGLFLALWTVRRRGRAGVVWMDEVIDAMDDEGIEGLRGWLAEVVGREGGRAFLMTHREAGLGGSVLECGRGVEGGVVYRLR